MFNFLLSLLCVFSWEVMQCSAAMDILFLMDGSYSVGKSTFERSKHYAIKLCQAVDIGSDKVCFLSVLISLSLFLSCQSLLSNSVLVQVRVGLIQFGSSPRLEFALDLCTTKQELKKQIKNISYRSVSPLVISVRFCFGIQKNGKVGFQLGGKMAVDPV